MSKIAFIGDTHFGVRSCNLHFLNFQTAWLEHMILDAKAKGVTEFFQVGDWNDIRRYTDNYLMHHYIHVIIPLLRKHGVKMTVIVGNHDIYYRSSNEVFSTEILGLIAPDVFRVYSTIQDIEVGDTTFCAIPWLDDKNSAELVLKLHNSKAKFAVGHLELEGFAMYKGSIAEHGLDSDVFKKFDLVVTGHYHTISKQKNIQYIGSPYHLTWADYIDGNNRGYFILDTATGSFELQKNPEGMTLFSIMEYDPEKEYTKDSFDEYKGKILKVIVKEKKEDRHYKKFSKFLNELQLIDFKVIDQTIVLTKEVVVDEKTLHLDTIGVFHGYIDMQPSGTVDKEALKVLATEIFKEANVNI